VRKIPTIYQRNLQKMQEIVPIQNSSCYWVFEGEGVATRKYDGTCCLIDNGKLFKRRELKQGSPVPVEFVKADFDEVTGKTVGWMPVTPDDKWHIAAFKEGLPDGTYELLGPKIQGNPEGFADHRLLKHSDAERYELKDVNRTFLGLREFMMDKDIEGLVFHHSDGRMAKIKKRDYGLKRT